jgi:hypothetical protein
VQLPIHRLPSDIVAFALTLCVLAIAACVVLVKQVQPKPTTTLPSTSAFLHVNIGVAPTTPTICETTLLRTIASASIQDGSIILTLGKFLPKVESVLQCRYLENLLHTATNAVLVIICWLAQAFRVMGHEKPRSRREPRAALRPERQETDRWQSASFQA